MGQIRVHRFLYRDRTTGLMTRCGDYATESAILEIGGKVLPEYLDVDGSRVGGNGMLTPLHAAPDKAP